MEKKEKVITKKWVRANRAVMIRQLQKGISVQLDILRALKNLPRELAEILRKH